ncbi:Villin/Gelsolin [Sesbania bispinosa]|nr:Villin/Gelsolin [Sesbania bispinosa]
MSSATKVLDPAFQGVEGLKIWRIENFQSVPLPKSEYGKFYMGDSYIILQTTQGKGGAYLYDIHFWLGKDTSQDEAGTAAIKTVELDASLGGRAVQHREIQGHESDKFLSYFKPCIIPLEGGVASGFKKPEEEEFETRLYVCRGKRVVRIKQAWCSLFMNFINSLPHSLIQMLFNIFLVQVPFARSSLNHDDVFILDTQDKIYQFNGANSNIQERAKALEVIQLLKEKYHEGKCDVAIVDDGKLDTESDSGEFWVLFGGFAPIGKKVISEDDIVPETVPAQLYSIADGEVKPVEGELSKSLLENNKCYLLDCGAEVFVWVGRVTQVEERKAACQAAEVMPLHNLFLHMMVKSGVINFANCSGLCCKSKRPKSTRVTRVIQGYETHSFKSNFDSWPSGSAAAGSEEGRGKVAALLKQQGMGVKGVAKSTPVNEEVPPLLEGGGKMEVWLINGNAKTPLPKEDIGKFYSGDCYIVLYTYHSGERKEDYYLCCWFGKDSIEEDQKMATRLASTMFNSLKGRPVQVLVAYFEGKEPPQFVALFQPMVVLKIKVCQMRHTQQRVLHLFEFLEHPFHNNKAVQVDAHQLNSTECFLLQSGSTVFTWHGNQCTFEQQQLAAKVAEFLRSIGYFKRTYILMVYPSASLVTSLHMSMPLRVWFSQELSLKHAKEGNRNLSFPGLPLERNKVHQQKVTNDVVRDPTFVQPSHLIEVEEVYNFSQDDLLTEDILILDTHAEVFVGLVSVWTQKKNKMLFEIAQKYIYKAASSGGLSPQVPLYKVTEGNEPCFFTQYFSWDHAKAMKHTILTHIGMKNNLKFYYKGSIFKNKCEAEIIGLKKNLRFKGTHSRKGDITLCIGHAVEINKALLNLLTGKAQWIKSRGPRQRAEALAALSNAFNSSPVAPSSADKLNGLNQGGPRQRAEALAALNSAFSSSSATKNFTPRPSGRSQGSQRAAAVAALSSVLTAEKKKPSPETSPVASTSPVVESSTFDTKSESAHSETEGVEEVAEAKETEEVAPETGSNGDSEPKQENVEDGNDGQNNQSFFTYEQLKTKTGSVVSGIDLKRRENYLSEEEFQTVFGMTKEAFSKLPRWKQDMLKRKFDLF